MTIPPSSIEQAIPVDDAPAEPQPARRRRSLPFLRNGKAVTGLIILGFYGIVAIIGPWVTPYDPDAGGDDLVAPPSADHWLGTTHLGQDVFSQLVAGTRGVMLVGLAAAVIATILSVLIGVSSAYLGGVVDDGLSALSNVFLVIPALPLIIIVASSVQNAGDAVVALVIGLTSWAWGARVLRAQTLSLRRRDYVEAARATGESTWRLICFEIMPNLTAVIVSGFIGTMIFAVMSEITLSFIGIGGGASWNWGAILYWAQSQQALAQGAWWWFVPAGLAIAILGTALSLVNFGIDEYVSPRLRNAGRTTVRTATGRAVRMRVGFTPVLGSAPSRTTDRPATPVLRASAPAPVGSTSAAHHHGTDQVAGERSEAGA